MSLISKTLGLGKGKTCGYKRVNIKMWNEKTTTKKPEGITRIGKIKKN